MNKIDKEDILLFRDTVNTQAPVDKDGVSRIRKLKRKPPTCHKSLTNFIILYFYRLSGIQTPNISFDKH
jgi:hypothetical protein